MSVFGARRGSISNELITAQQGEVLKVGFLRKKGHLRRNWLDRWFVLTTEGLYYYKTKDDHKPQGVIPLVRGEVREDTSGRHQNVFTCVTIEGKDYNIQASTKDEMLVWIKVISEAIHNATVRENNPELRAQKQSSSSNPIPEERSVSNGSRTKSVSKSESKSASKQPDDYDSYEEDEED
jgi:hypothetical protein